MQLKQQVAVQGTCNACGHDEFILHGVQRYGHVWFIPLFPLEKVYFLTCSNCHSTISNEATENLIQRDNVPEFKTPFLSYVGGAIGLGVFALMFIFTLFIGLSTSKKSRQISNSYITKSIQEPVAVDDLLILYVKKELGYALARVAEVEKSTIVIQVSKMLYNSKSELISKARTSQEVFKNEFYVDEYYEIKFDQLKEEMPLKMIIVRTDRPHSLDTEAQEKMLD